MQNMWHMQRKCLSGSYAICVWHRMGPEEWYEMYVKTLSWPWWPCDCSLKSCLCSRASETGLLTGQRHTTQ